VVKVLTVAPDTLLELFIGSLRMAHRCVSRVFDFIFYFTRFCARHALVFMCSVCLSVACDESECGM
jgi:hypothetical protein